MPFFLAFFTSQNHWKWSQKVPFKWFWVISEGQQKGKKNGMKCAPYTTPLQQVVLITLLYISGLQSWLYSCLRCSDVRPGNLQWVLYSETPLDDINSSKHHRSPVRLQEYSPRQRQHLIHLCILPGNQKNKVSKYYLEDTMKLKVKYNICKWKTMHPH